MCRHIYNWNAVACDVKQPLSLTLLLFYQGQITISSDTNPEVGIEFLAIPFGFDFAFKMHIKEKSFKHSIN